MRIAAVPLIGLVLVCASGRPAQAQATASPEEVARLREELEQLRKAVTALEARLDALPAPPPPASAAAPAPAPTAPVEAAAVPAGAQGAGGPAGALPLYGGGAAASKVFNPDIAAIGDFLGAVGRSPGGGEPSLQMHESELSFQAVVDPYARADFFLTFGPEEVGVEEASSLFPRRRATCS